MPFSFVSSLPNNISEQNKRDLCSSFECDIDTIKGYLTEIANTYLLVAYRLYEINRYRTYKPKYKNIVEACQSELGFKKSTTYNMISIVEKFGKPDSSGFITYSSLFGLEKFSYSQLCEMLSLSDNQRLKVTPEMTVKEIREFKKEEKVIDIFVDPINIVPVEPVIESVSYQDPVAAPERPENFQTSGKSDVCYDLCYTAFDFTCSNCLTMIDLDFYEGTEDDYNYKDEDLYLHFCPVCGCRVVSKNEAIACNSSEDML